MLEDNRAKWAAFIAKNAEILMTLEELWQHNFQKSQTFMREHKRRPSQTKEGEEALGQWLNIKSLLQQKDIARGQARTDGGASKRIPTINKIEFLIPKLFCNPQWRDTRGLMKRARRMSKHSRSK